MCYHCATNPSILHCCCHVAAVSLLQLRRCGAFTVTLSRFCHRRHGVTFVIALLWFCRRHRGVAFTSVTVLSSLLWCLCCRIVVVSLSPLLCHLHRHIVAVFVAISSSPSWCRLRRCIVTVSLLWFCCRCCGVTFTVASSSPRSVIVAVTSLRGCGCGCGHGHIMVVVIMVVVVVVL